MKILRQHLMVFGALVCVAGFAKEGSKVAADLCNVVVAKRPDSYVLVSTLQMLDTMGGKKNLVDWSCYADYNANEDRPSSRTTIWLEGIIKRAPGEKPGISLFDIGAQHRTAVVKLRIAPLQSDYKLVTVLRQKQPDGSEAEVITEQPTDAAGFYCVMPRNAGVGEYWLRSGVPGLRLEAYFPAHPPGSQRQFEDGGPPSIPPVNEN